MQAFFLELILSILPSWRKGRAKFFFPFLLAPLDLHQQKKMAKSTFSRISLLPRALAWSTADRLYSPLSRLARPSPLFLRKLKKQDSVLSLPPTAPKTSLSIRLVICTFFPLTPSLRLIWRNRRRSRKKKGV